MRSVSFSKAASLKEEWGGQMKCRSSGWEERTRLQTRISRGSSKLNDRFEVHELSIEIYWNILKVSTSLIVLIYWLRPFNPASFSKVEERAWEPSYSWLLLYLGDQFWVLQIYSHRYQICWRTSPFLSSSSFLLLWGKRETTNK